MWENLSLTEAAECNVWWGAARKQHGCRLQLSDTGTLHYELLKLNLHVFYIVISNSLIAGMERVSVCVPEGSMRRRRRRRETWIGVNALLHFRLIWDWLSVSRTQGFDITDSGSHLWGCDVLSTRRLLGTVTDAAVERKGGSNPTPNPNSPAPPPTVLGQRRLWAPATEGPFLEGFHSAAENSTEADEHKQHAAYFFLCQIKFFFSKIVENIKINI